MKSHHQVSRYTYRASGGYVLSTQVFLYVLPNTQLTFCRNFGKYNELQMPIFTNFSTIGLIFNTWTATIWLYLKYLGSEKKVTTRGKMLINDLLFNFSFLPPMLPQSGINSLNGCELSPFSGDVVKRQRGYPIRHPSLSYPLPCLFYYFAVS